MNSLFRMTLAVAPLLAGAASVMAAQPLILDSVNMDRITAGSKPLLERVASVLQALPRSADDTDQAGFQSLDEEQMALLTRALEDERFAFTQARTGERTSHQLTSGEKQVIVKEVSSSPVASATEAAASSPAAAAVSPPQAEQITTRLINPGETVNVRQTSVGGTNYLYIRSTGNSAITVTQRNGF
jgi:hypothetical protein